MKTYTLMIRKVAWVEQHSNRSSKRKSPAAQLTDMDSEGSNVTCSRVRAAHSTNVGRTNAFLIAKRSRSNRRDLTHLTVD